MSICPFAVKKLIKPGPNDPRIKPRLGIWHVDAGNAESLFNQFSNQNIGIESHFFIKRSGVLEQYRDTDWEADANYLANPFALSVETQGFGYGIWTPEQIDTSQRLMLWMNDEHDIPLHKAKRWDGDGFGYHIQFGAPGPWTPVAKACPGKYRIKQFDNTLVPWLNTGAKLDIRPTLNITKALEADTRAERKQALRKVIRHGSSEASQAAKAWLSAINAIEDAQAIAHEARADLKDEEVRR